MKKSNLLFILGLLGLACSSAFGAGNINDIANVVGEGDATIRTTTGYVFTWIISMGLPIGLIIMGAFIGYTIAKQKIDQCQQGQGKLVGYVLGAAIAGGFVYFLLVGILGAAMLGDSTKMYDVIFNFWSDVLKV